MPGDHCPDCGRQSSKFDPDMDDKEWKFCHAWTADDGLVLECKTKAVERLKAELLMYGPPYHERLRNSFAGHALQGILSDAHNGGIEHDNMETVYKVARDAKDYANALLAALDYTVSETP